MALGRKSYIPESANSDLEIMIKIPDTTIAKNPNPTTLAITKVTNLYKLFHHLYCIHLTVSIT